MEGSYAFFRSIEWKYFAVDLGLANASGDKWCVLRTVVEYDNGIEVHVRLLGDRLGCGSGRHASRQTPKRNRVACRSAFGMRASS